MEDEELKQLPFAFEVPQQMGRDDFMVANCNSEAFQMVESWPNWLTKGVVIYGPEGCGKSHLARMFADKILSSDTPKKGSVGIINATQVKMRNVKRIAAENKNLVIENLTVKADNEALFHLFNIYQNEPERYMLWTARIAPHRMRFGLKDLQSRLNMLPSIAIKEPDDMMLQTLIVKLFNDRQLLISPEILEYILLNTRRSFAYVERLVEEIDAVSLAYQTAVDYFTVKKALEILEEQEDKQPDLFDGW